MKYCYYYTADLRLSPIVETGGFTTPLAHLGILGTKHWPTAASEQEPKRNLRSRNSAARGYLYLTASTKDHKSGHPWCQGPRSYLVLCSSTTVCRAPPPAYPQHLVRSALRRPAERVGSAARRMRTSFLFPKRLQQWTLSTASLRKRNFRSISELSVTLTKLFLLGG